MLVVPRPDPAADWLLRRRNNTRSRPQTGLIASHENWFRDRDPNQGLVFSDTQPVTNVTVLVSKNCWCSQNALQTGNKKAAHDNKKQNTSDDRKT